MFTTRRIIGVLLGVTLGCTVSTADQGCLTLSSGEDDPTGRHLPLSPAEEHLRTGVVMLAKLYRSLAEVKDAQTAQSAVPGVVQITRDLQTWIQTLHGMKQGVEEQEVLERTYVPIIEKLNAYIEVQGERLAIAHYFGSQDLATALTALYIMAQQ